MKIGILGYGSIGKRHAANVDYLGHHDDWYDPNLKKRLYCPPGYRESLIKSSDAIIICSPTPEHENDITDCLSHGKHILCEKPFGYSDPTTLEASIKYYREFHDNRVIATGFNLRFHACVQEAKRLMPEIGDVIFANFTVCQKTEKPVYLRDGIIRNWCSHEIDLANYLLGPGGKVVNCTATLDDDGNDSIEAVISMKYPNVENYVFIQADYYTDPERRYFFIEGTKGGIYVDLVQRNVFRVDKATGKRWQALAATDTFDQNYIDEMKCFIQSIETGAHQAPLATAEDGIAALYQVMDARNMAEIK
jgi:myo-inositol 2-dehydrogenase/D-chiro-inositol 1-dehydrogenase